MRAVYNFTQKRQNLSASCRFPLKLAPAAAGGARRPRDRWEM